MTTRTLRAIALEIQQAWPSPYFGAVPYLKAMAQIQSIADKCGADDARIIVTYFLSNATGWRGEAARRIKAELKEMLKCP